MFFTPSSNLKPTKELIRCKQTSDTPINTNEDEEKKITLQLFYSALIFSFTTNFFSSRFISIQPSLPTPRRLQQAEKESRW